MVRRLAILSLVLTLSGCATPSGFLHPASRYTGPTVRLSGVDYMPLKLFCDGLGYNCAWDRFRGVAMVAGDRLELACLVGSSAILLNGQPAVLGAPVRWYDGAVMVPRTLEEFFRAPAQQPAAVRVLKRHPIRHVVIDPGHGGKDPGAIGVGGLREKVVVLDVAQQVARDLRARGYEVTMTRSDDTFIELPDRGESANAKRADFFISIHANANRNAKVQGVEVYYLVPQSMDIEMDRAAKQARAAALPYDSAVLGTTADTKAIVWDLLNVERRRQAIELGRVIAAHLSREVGARNNGVKGARFQVLRDTHMPAVLVEMGYLTHPTEGTRLGDRSHRQRVASAITAGITDYFQRYEQTDAFSQ